MTTTTEHSATGDAPSPEHPNVVLMREFFDAFAAADRDRLAAVMEQDLIYHLPGTSPISGHWHGVDGLLGGVRAIAMTLGRGNNGFELLKVFADDEVAITVHRDSYHGDDNTLDLRYLLYVRIAGGKMAEVWEVPFDQGENDRYFALQAATFARMAAGQAQGA